MSPSPSPASGLWGRAWYTDLWTLICCVLLLVLPPLAVFYFYLTAFHFQADLFAPLQQLLSGNFIQLWNLLPGPSWAATQIVALWIGLQLVLALVPDRLHRILKSYRGGEQLGAVTPSGQQLFYRVNGLQAWVVSHLLFLLGAFVFEWFSPTIIFDHWGELLVLANIIGYTVAILAYIKAYYAPSWAKDNKYSGSFIYDFYMGIELHPRIGPLDLKLFFNGRPGIVAWTLINLSFAAAQYQTYGFVTNSMLLVNLFQALYVLYFFWKETWYLNTIDIHHDHFGWMFAWGDCVWLPFMYTLQGLFLVFWPVELSPAYALIVLFIGLVGFALFVSANNQKDRFRSQDGQAKIWGKPPTYIATTYTTSDGQPLSGRLLTSGWWGLARHMNYTGDLILSLAYSLACGFSHIFPYFYFLFMLVLLLHRCFRDEDRCSHKYGNGWNTYCQQVPYRLIPGIF